MTLHPQSRVLDTAVVRFEAHVTGRTSEASANTTTVTGGRGTGSFRARLPGQQRFQREDRREFRHSLSIATAVVCSRIAWALPVRTRNWIADRIGDALYHLTPAYRQNVADNLAHVTGKPADSPELAAMTRAIFRLSSRNFGDLLVVPHQTTEEIIRAVPFVEGDWSILDEALARGKGVIFVSGHTGSFDLVGQLLHAKGYPLNVMTGRTVARFVFDMVTHLRGSRGIRMCEPTPSGVRRVIQAVRRNECAVFVTDRDFFQNGKPVTMFGQPTTLPLGAVRIGRDTGAALIPLFGDVTRQRHGVRLLPAIYVPKTTDIEADLAGGLSQIVTVLERVIGDHPEQWVMFQRVWPQEAAGPHRAVPPGSPPATGAAGPNGGASPRSRHRSPVASQTDQPPTSHTG